MALGGWLNSVRRAAPAFLAALVLASTALGVGEFADVHLYDGRHFFGKVVEEDANKIVLEIHHGSIVVNMTFGADEVRSIERHEAPEEPDADAVPQDDGADDTTTPEGPEPGGTGGWAIVPVSGVVGEEITAGFFKAARREAERAGAEGIVFHLRSPGGLVREMVPIRRELDETERAMRVAFFVDEEAFSAAALLCLSCKDFYVGEGARIGAAVAFRWGTGAAEVDAKFSAAFSATWRAHAERAGRNPALVDAMVEMKTELWADTSTEPWTLSTHEPGPVRRAEGADDAEHPAGGPEADEGRFVELDDEKSILALTHSQAVNVGAADGLLRRPRDVALKLDLASPEREAFDGERFSERYFRTYRNNMERARRAVQDVGEAAAMLEGAQNRAEFKNRLREIMANLNRVITLYERYDYVRNYIDAQGHSIQEFEALARLIRRALGRG